MRTLAIALLVGCVGSIGPTPAPTLVPRQVFVTVAPGIQQAAYSDDPLYRVEGEYFLYRDGVWLVSSSPDRDFQAAGRLPGQLVALRTR